MPICPGRLGPSHSKTRCCTRPKSSSTSTNQPTVAEELTSLDQVFDLYFDNCDADKHASSSITDVESVPDTAVEHISQRISKGSSSAARAAALSLNKSADLPWSNTTTQSLPTRHSRRTAHDSRSSNTGLTNMQQLLRQKPNSPNHAAPVNKWQALQQLGKRKASSNKKQLTQQPSSSTNLPPAGDLFDVSDQQVKPDADESSLSNRSVGVQGISTSTMTDMVDNAPDLSAFDVVQQQQQAQQLHSPPQQQPSGAVETDDGQPAVRVSSHESRAQQVLAALAQQQAADSDHRQQAAGSSQSGSRSSNATGPVQAKIKSKLFGSGILSSDTSMQIVHSTKQKRQQRMQNKSPSALDAALLADHQAGDKSRTQRHSHVTGDLPVAHLAAADDASGMSSQQGLSAAATHISTNTSKSYQLAQSSTNVSTSSISSGSVQTEGTGGMTGSEPLVFTGAVAAADRVVSHQSQLVQPQGNTHRQSGSGLATVTGPQSAQHSSSNGKHMSTAMAPRHRAAPQGSPSNNSTTQQQQHQHQHQTQQQHRLSNNSNSSSIKGIAPLDSRTWPGAVKKLFPSLYSPEWHSSFYSFLFDLWPTVATAHSQNDKQHLKDSYGFVADCFRSSSKHVQAVMALSMIESLGDADELLMCGKYLEKDLVEQWLLPMVQQLQPDLYADVVYHAAATHGRLTPSQAMPLVVEGALQQLQQLRAVYAGVELPTLAHIAQQHGLLLD
eukprot:jgi/Chrzof1/4457/Cz14g13250.t1